MDFLLSLAFMIIEHYLTKGGEAVLKHAHKLARINALYKEAEARAKKYDEVMNDDSKSLEEKLRAIDDLGL